MKTLGQIKSKKNIDFLDNLIDAKDRFNPTNLELKITTNEQEFGQAKQLLIDLSYIKNKLLINKPSINQSMTDTNFLYDGYDSYAKHMIVKDLSINKVVAYVRIIDTQTACNIGGYFCETQFNINNFRFKTLAAIELSHVAIDPKCANPKLIELLWSGINHYADERGIDTIFGALSLNIENSHYPATREINSLKTKYLSPNNYRVKPYNILPPSRAVAGDNYEFPEIVDFIFDHGAMLCGDASWNNILNQAEIFFYINNQSNQQIPLHLQQYDISSSDLVA